MTQKKLKLKLKPKFKKIFLVIGIILVILLILLFIYLNKRGELSSLGYSDKAIDSIFQKFKVSYVEEVGENKMINAAFESKDYKEKNLESYEKIEYQDQKDIIKNVNTLLDKGYKTSEISLILSRGDNDSVTEFAKRDKVNYLDEFLSVDYAKLKNLDRYVAYQEQEHEDAETTVLYVNLDFDKEDYEDPLEITDFDPDVLVNKHRQLTEDYVPEDLETFDEEDTKADEKVKATKEVVDAFAEMKEAASEEGLTLMVSSGYRSYQDQEEITNTYLEAYGQNYVNNYVAKPGFSEHQTGMSIDVASGTENIFVESDEYSWMMDNAYLYGFILRYPKSKEDITGYKCEAWHYRYVGKKIASYIKEHDITYDEYYVMFLDK